MYLKKKMNESTKNYSANLIRLKRAIYETDAIVIGAGAGLSSSAGFEYGGKRFQKYFSDFAKKYGLTDMYSAGFYPFESLEEYWAYWSRHIMINRYQGEMKGPYTDLLALMKDKNYFIITTNVDHCFQRAGFDKERLFYTQGDYGLWQCSKACHQKTYDNKEQVKKMIAEQKDMRIPSHLIPICPHCGSFMTMNLRMDESFVEDEGWHLASKRYTDFLNRFKNQSILFLELGIGNNTPGIVKFPFWKMTAENPKATYACVNLGEAFTPIEILDRSICINADIGQVLKQLSDNRFNCFVQFEKIIS